MRAFVILSFVAMACADQLGYNYQPVGHSQQGLSSAPGGAISSGIGGAIGAGIGGGFGGGLGSGIGGGHIGSGHAAGPVSYNTLAGPTQYNKEFFSFSAPEHEFDDNQANQRIAASVKKNLRVVFIKTPENKGLENAVLNLVKQSAEQKTAIYVLQKQTDIGELTNKLNVIRNNANNKPEVHFVKYRTPEDAANAQRQIQSQYNSLEGPSQSHDGGIAPVINFASQGPVQAAPAARAPGSAYLPASIIRRFRS